MSGKLLVSLLPMIKIKPEAMDSAIATVEVMDCAMVMNARHSSAQLEVCHLFKQYDINSRY
jgi:hypothetical protein